jgi:hypothetical protein
MPAGAQTASTPPTTRTSLFIEHFDDAGLLKRGWYDGNHFRITTDATAAAAGAGCMEYEWRQGDSQPRGSSVARRSFEPTSSIYVAYDLRLSKRWGWTRKGYHPHLIHVLTTESDRFAGPAATHLTLYIELMDGKLRLAAQDIANKDTPHGLTQGPLRGGYNGTFFDSDHALFTDDRWHHIEAEFTLNTLDVEHDRANHDGVVRGWFDGDLVVDRHDVVLRSCDFPRMQFNQLLIAPYFGPGLLPHAQTLWIDELTVATTRRSDSR